MKRIVQIVASILVFPFLFVAALAYIATSSVPVFLGALILMPGVPLVSVIALSLINRQEEALVDH